MENDTSQKIGRRDTPIDAGLQISVSVLLSILAGNSLNHEGLLKYINDCMTHRQKKRFRRKLCPSTSLLKLSQFLKFHERSQVCLNECYLANSKQRKKPPHAEHSEKN